MVKAATKIKYTVVFACGTGSLRLPPSSPPSWYSVPTGGVVAVLLVVAAVGRPILLQGHDGRRARAPRRRFPKAALAGPVGLHPGRRPVPEGSQQGRAGHLSVLDSPGTSRGRTLSLLEHSTLKYSILLCERSGSLEIARKPRKTHIYTRSAIRKSEDGMSVRFLWAQGAFFFSPMFLVVSPILFPGES